MIRRLIHTCLIAAALAAAPSVRAQSTIELRPNAHIPPGTPITLALVARLEGADAVALAGVPLPSATGGSLSIEDVHRAIDASGRVNWGRITLRGATCNLLGPGPEPKAAAPAPVAPLPSDPNSVRAAVETQMARVLRVATDDLQLTFAPEDGDFLSTRTTGRTVEVHPTAMADKMPLRIAVYEGDRIIGGEHTIRVGIRVRREVLIALVAKRRGEIIAPEDYSAESRWIGPTARPAMPDQVAGAAIRGRVNPGEIIDAEDVAPAVAVNKGDIVAIRCVSGGVVLATRARAITAGRDGDLIEFQALDSKRRFFARMDGRGRAIVAADPGPKDLPLPTDPSPRGSLPVRGGRIPPPMSTETQR